MAPPGTPVRRKMSRSKKRNKSLRRVSDSSFNIKKLSSSRVSTPIVGLKNRNRNRKNQSVNRDGKQKRKLSLNSSKQNKRCKVQSDTSQECSTTLEEGEIRNNSAISADVNNKSTKSINNSTLSAHVNKTSTKSKKRRLPAGHVFRPGGANNIDDLPNLFRNDFLLVGGGTTGLPPSSQSVIVIDEDEEVGEEAAAQKTVVEAVGEELLQLASGSAKPDTPRTLIQRKHVDLGNKENHNETIVLDDTEEREGSPDSIIILEEVPKPESVQEIASKYFTPCVSMDFIPLNTHSQPVSKPKQQRKNLNKHKNLETLTEPGSHPFFRPYQGPPNLNFGPQPGSDQVFRFSGGPRRWANHAPSSHLNPRHASHRVTRWSGARGGEQSTPAAVNAGPTIYSEEKSTRTGLRPIVIDGSNIAMAHGKSRKFSVKGIQIVVQYFKDRGHEHVVAFLPQCKTNRNTCDSPETLFKMEGEGTVIFTPSRYVNRGLIVSYDDRMILDYAVEKEAVVITRDNYRDLYEENQKYHSTIQNRLLMPTFVGDTLIFPQDPLGRNGPRLDEFLMF